MLPLVAITGSMPYDIAYSLRISSVMLAIFRACIVEFLRSRADEVLRNYGRAFGVPSNVMLSMNFSNNVSSHRMNHGNTISTIMVDNSSYQSALKTSDRMIEIYDTELKASTSNSDFIDNAKSDLVVHYMI